MGEAQSLEAPREEAPDTRHASTLTAVPDERGFVLVVDLAPGRSIGADARAIVHELHRRLLELAPAAEVQASLIRTPTGGTVPPLDTLRSTAARTATPPRRGYVYRRGPAPVAPDGVVIDLPRKQLCVEGRLAQLTFTEYEILEYLISHSGQAVERSELLWAVWGPWPSDRPSERTIDVHIRRLRAKLGAYGSIVRTVRGSGYRYDPHADVHVRRHSDTSKAPCAR